MQKIKESGGRLKRVLVNYAEDVFCLILVRIVLAFRELFRRILSKRKSIVYFLRIFFKIFSF